MAITKEYFGRGKIYFDHGYIMFVYEDHPDCEQFCDVELVLIPAKKICGIKYIESNSFDSIVFVVDGWNPKIDGASIFRGATMDQLEEVVKYIKKIQEENHVCKQGQTARDKGIWQYPPFTWFKTWAG